MVANMDELHDFAFELMQVMNRAKDLGLDSYALPLSKLCLDACSLVEEQEGNRNE